MNPARQTIDGRGDPPRSAEFCVTMPARTKLIAPQDTNCTTEGRELNFGKPGADAAEQAVCIFRRGMTDTMRVRLKKCFGAVIHAAEIRLRVEVKRICARKTNFDHAFAALHRIKASPKKIAVIEDITGRGHDIDVIQSRLCDRGIAADGRKLQFAGAKRADERSASASDDDITRNFLQVNIAGNAFQ